MTTLSSPRRRGLVLLATLLLTGSLVWVSAAASAPAVQQPKNLTSAAGMGGTMVEDFKLASPAMGKDVAVVVILPPGYADNAEKRYPVLYTLHGRGAPFHVFKDMTTVHKALADHPMIVVGFDAERASWYQDATAEPGVKYLTFFFKTLVPSIDAHYRTLADGKHRAVTGFSMGGFGALHYLLANPKAFASASSMSGAFEPLAIGWVKKDFVALFGPEAENKKAYAMLDIPARLKAVARRVKLPPIYVTCGTEDSLIEQSRRMRDLLTELKVPNEYAEAPGGHKFAFWKAAAGGVIDFHWRTFQDHYTPRPTKAETPAKE